jgi:hypothetical protein
MLARETYQIRKFLLLEMVHCLKINDKINAHDKVQPAEVLSSGLFTHSKAIYFQQIVQHHQQLFSVISAYNRRLEYYSAFSFDQQDTAVNNLFPKHLERNALLKK